MKKAFIAIALMTTIAIGSTNAMAQGPNWHMNTNGMYNGSASSQAYQDFVNSTKELRSEIIADRAELAAIMAGPTPDPKRARSLTENINKNVTILNEKATAQNLPTNHMMRFQGMGPGMMGNNMMGSRMMGNNMMNSGYGCNW